MLEKLFNITKSSHKDSKHSIKVCNVSTTNVDRKVNSDVNLIRSSLNDVDLVDKSSGIYTNGSGSLDDPLDFDLPWITEPSSEPLKSEDNSIRSPNSVSPTLNGDESSFVDEIEEDCTSLGTSSSYEVTSCCSDLSIIGTSAEWPIGSAQMMAIKLETLIHPPPFAQTVDINNNTNYGLFGGVIRNRITSISEASYLNKTGERVNRAILPWARPKPFNLNYNTNFKRPPETWLRTRHAGHTLYRHHPIVNRHNSILYNYTYSKTSWAAFAFRFAGRARKLHHKGYMGLYQSGCLCCGCCYCAKSNQTYCCCCYHCVHRVSTCRRPDLSFIKPTTSISRKSISSAIIPAPPSQAPPPPPIGEKLKLSSDDDMESGLDSGTDSPIHRRCSTISQPLSDDRNSLRF